MSGVGLTGPDGQDVRAVLAQPKRLALLVYLAVAQPAGFHRRDTLLALFWPESNVDGARAALSRALHHLRQALGADVIISRGDDEVALARTRLSSDLFDLTEALERRDAAAALALYTSDFLTGFHLDDVAAFDHWVDGERDRIRASVCTAAGEASRTAERAGDLAVATSLARRASELSPYTESAMLELMRLLDAQGNRADALLAYEAFAKRLRNELETDPSAALAAAAERIRAGRPAVSDGAHPARQALPSADASSIPSAVAHQAGDTALDSVPTASGMRALPPTLLDETALFERALGIYAVAFVMVAILAKVAIAAIGLPDWVFPGALIVMALGLPVMLWTGYVYRVTRRAVMGIPVSTFGPGRSATAHGAIESLALKTAPRLSWYRTARGGMFALAAFVVIVAAFMTMRAFGIGPAGSLLAAGKLRQNDPILITDFRVTNADAALGRAASDAVRQALSLSSVITLVPPTAVAAALRRAERPPSTQLDVPLARDLAMRQGIKAIIDGDVDVVGGGYLVTVRLIGVDSLAQLASVTASGEGPQGFVNAVDRATRDFRAKVGESLRRVRSAPPLSEVTTDSLDALIKYSAASRANDIEGDFPKAAELAREATSIDTGFAMAWVLLANAVGNSRVTVPGGRATVDSAIQRAYAMRAHLGERERGRVMMIHSGSGRHRDRVKSIAASEALLALGDPHDSANAELQLGREYANRQDFARADSCFVLGIRADSTFLPLQVNRPWFLFTAGHLSDARDAAQLAARRFPTSWVVQATLREMLYHQGRLVELRRQYDSVEAAGNLDMRSWAIAGKATMALRDGRLAEWRRLLARLTPVDSARGFRRDERTDAATTAKMDAEARGSSAHAVDRLELALTRNPLRNSKDIDRPYFVVSNAFAATGHPDRARTILAEYNSQVTDTALRRLRAAEYHQALAEVLIAEHHPAGAITEFRLGYNLPDGPNTACAICLPLSLARAFDAAGQADSAVTQYEYYLSTPGYFQRFGTPPTPMTPGLDAVWLPIIHRRLGELYAAKGATAKAAEHFRAFIELWKNADPELQPRVAEARRRLAALTPVARPR